MHGQAHRLALMLLVANLANKMMQKCCKLTETLANRYSPDTGELGYDGPLYDRFLHMTDYMLGPSLMHIKYLSYVYDRFCI